jgi:photosystem II stability/assembly factor-like uncharacterized protein
MNIIKLFFLVITPFFFVGNQLLDFQQAFTPSQLQTQKETNSVAANIIFQSTDNGITWQDISKGLPENMESNNFFANDKGLYIPAGAGMFHSKPNALAPSWDKELFIFDPGDIVVCRSGMYGMKYEGEISQKILGMNLWVPIYTNFQKKNLRTIYETSTGSILIGSDSGLFKSIDNGKSWKLVLNKGWVIKIVEADGVLIATNQEGIIRSKDDGENWDLVVSEGGVGIDVSSIANGFAAITYNTDSKTRRVRASYDSGKTWQAIDAGLPPHDLIANIIQVGDYFFCGHPKGIYRSSDKGKTWELMLPSIGGKVFNLSGLGSVIYALPRNGGC